MRRCFLPKPTPLSGVALSSPVRRRTRPKPDTSLFDVRAIPVMAHIKEEGKKTLKTPTREPPSVLTPLSKPLTPKNPPVNCPEFIRKVKGTGACRRCGNIFHKKEDCSAPIEFVSDTPPLSPGEKHHCYSIFVDSDDNDDRVWQISTSASCHICSHREYFSTYEPVEEYIKFTGCEGRIIGVGTVVLRLVCGNTLVLHGVKHVPMVKNIISHFLVGSQIEIGGGRSRLIYDGMVVAEGKSNCELLVDEVVIN